MYDPGMGYWINVNKDSLTSEEIEKFRGYLDFPNNIVSCIYLCFYFQENAGVMHTGVCDEVFTHRDLLVKPKEFMHVFKLYSISKELALIACVDTVKRKLQEEFGGLEY